MTYVMYKTYKTYKKLQKSSKTCDYIMFYISREKYLQFPHFSHKVEFLGKSKMAATIAAILDNVTDPQQRYNP